MKLSPCPNCGKKSPPKDIKYLGDQNYRCPKCLETQSVIIDALNRIDELACAYTTNNEEIREGWGEAEQLELDYNLVFDFIQKSFKKGGKHE